MLNLRSKNSAGRTLKRAARSPAPSALFAVGYVCILSVIFGYDFDSPSVTLTCISLPFRTKPTVI